ncbi:putative F-box domain-containing protein [Seiridium unicorne]|uniref:F-box domain-containing protein n=1 Tax=Seiridium unicorne TaxID=138068 RepID=A0ABR2V443_9PEZI
MAATEFRQFLQLPREIQDMIWVFYEASKPVTRHYFRLNGTDFIYTAVDPVHRTFLRNLHEEKGPKKMRLSYVCKSVYEKIEFAGSVYVTKHSMPISSMWQLPEDQSDWIRASYPSSAYVNFERDIFIFQNPFQLNFQPSDIQSVSDRRINITVDKTITWASRVQHVAVYPRKFGTHYAERYPEPQSFTKALRDMENLKTVYLVWSPKKRGCALAPVSTWSGKDVNKAGFVELSQFLEKHRDSRKDGREKDGFIRCYCDLAMAKDVRNTGMFAVRLAKLILTILSTASEPSWNAAASATMTIYGATRLLNSTHHHHYQTSYSSSTHSSAGVPTLRYFAICAGCLAGLFVSLNPGGFFERGYGIPGNQPILCSFNPAYHNFFPFLLRFAKALDVGVWSRFSSYVRTWSSIQPCPKNELVPNRRWYGHGDLPICPVRWVSFCLTSAVLSIKPDLCVPIKNEYAEATRICSLWSTRMRQKWREACAAASLTELIAFSRLRMHVSDEMVLQIRMMLQIKEIQVQQAMHDAQLSIRHQGMEGMSRTARGYEEPY